MWRIYTVIGYFALALLIPICMASVGAWRRARASRLVNCPADGGAATIGLDRWYAVRMHALGNPEFRIHGCTRWPDRSGCRQDCLVQLTGR
jgi:hypothetical protein